MAVHGSHFEFPLHQFLVLPQNSLVLSNIDRWKYKTCGDSEISKQRKNLV